MSDDQQNHGIEPAPPASDEPATEERRLAARRRFLQRGAAAGSGVLIYTIHHNRSFAGTKKVMVSSVAACTSLGGSEAKKTKVVDSVNPVQKVDKKTGLPEYDKKGNPVYEATKEVFECKVKD